MSSGPMMPSGKPGKFSTSVVSMSWPPGWSLVEDGSPSRTQRLEVGAGRVDGGGQAGGAGADDDDLAVVGHVRMSCLVDAATSSSDGTRGSTPSAYAVFPAGRR